MKGFTQLPQLQMPSEQNKFVLQEYWLIIHRELSGLVGVLSVHCRYKLSLCGSEYVSHSEIEMVRLHRLQNGLSETA